MYHYINGVQSELITSILSILGVLSIAAKLLNASGVAAATPQPLRGRVLRELKAP